MNIVDNKVSNDSPTLCVVYEYIGKQNSIAKIARLTVETALEAGWHVSVVAKWVDDDLAELVEWIPLFRPRRIFVFQWFIARWAVSQALRNRKFDVVHGFQPQAARYLDVLNCQFLTRVAAERKCFDDPRGRFKMLRKAQHLLVAVMEDHYWKHWNPTTHMVYCSELVQKEFHLRYSVLPRESVVPNAAPETSIPTIAERVRAKAFFGVPDVLVVGFLGGTDRRKGYAVLLESLASSFDISVMMAGTGSEGFVDIRFGSRLKALGPITDLTPFFNACDVLVVPSVFDPCPLVVFEAAAHGVPVIATAWVGNLPNVLRSRAGLEWSVDEPLAPLVRQICKNRDEFVNGATQLAKECSKEEFSRRFQQIYSEVIGARFQRVLV